MATYSEIATLIREYTSDNDPPLAAEIDPLMPWIIGQAEHRISQDLHFDAALITAIPTAPLTAGTIWIEKPTDWIANHRFWIHDLTTGITSFLQFRARSYLDRLFPYTETRGEPRLYCNYDAATWRVAPSLLNASNAEITYEARLTGLTPLMPTTWISTNHPDLLLKAALAECSIFHKAPANREVYEASYAQEVAGVKSEIQNQRADASNLQRLGI